MRKLFISFIFILLCTLLMADPELSCNDYESLPEIIQIAYLQGYFSGLKTAWEASKDLLIQPYIFPEVISMRDVNTLLFYALQRLSPIQKQAPIRGLIEALTSTLNKSVAN